MTIDKQTASMTSSHRRRPMLHEGPTNMDGGQEQEEEEDGGGGVEEDDAKALRKRTSSSLQNGDSITHPSPIPSSSKGTDSQCTNSITELTDCKIMAPVVFQCKKCRAIIGDSLHLHSIDPSDRVIILNAITDAVRVNEEPVMQPNKESFDYWSVFLPLICSYCDEMLGKCYQCGNKNIYHLIDKFIFNADLIDCYELGSMKGGHASTAHDEIFDIPTSLHLQKQIIKIIKFTISIKEDTDVMRSSLDAVRKRISILEDKFAASSSLSVSNDERQEDGTMGTVNDDPKRLARPIIRITCDPAADNLANFAQSKDNSPMEDKRNSSHKVSPPLEHNKPGKRGRPPAAHKQSPSSMASMVSDDSTTAKMTTPTSADSLRLSRSHQHLPTQLKSRKFLPKFIDE